MQKFEMPKEKTLPPHDDGGELAKLLLGEEVVAKVKSGTNQLDFGRVGTIEKPDPEDGDDDSKASFFHSKPVNRLDH